MGKMGKQRPEQTAGVLIINLSRQTSSVLQSVHDLNAPRKAFLPEVDVVPHHAEWEKPIDLGYRADSIMPIAQFHSHSFYEIYYFQAGECTYLIGDQLMTLRPGDLILMHGMTLHCPNSSPHVPYIRSIIHFDPAFLYQVLQKGTASLLLKPFEELRNIRLSLGEAEQAQFEKLLSEMNELQQRDHLFSASMICDRFTFRFFDLLELIRGWCTAPVNASEHSSLKERHVQNVVSYLEEHYTEELTLDQIAGALHLTKPYLSNLFKEVTGTTVFKYLYNRRINQAKILFRLEPERSVSDVSRMVGFLHLAHFSRLFKAAVGCSPEVYRKQLSQA
ncbi:AraC family transcriptional regulator [Paenibacillus sp. GCM10027626]|uniref:helix-turn-helix transcriptional regulator n=1 Tax=Paenibacillus sp. GCM10027626 TaxID=3273411 RepID=UPI00363FA958